MRQCLRVKGGRSLGDDTLVLGAVGVVEGTVVEMGVVEAAEGEAKQRLLDEAREVRTSCPAAVHACTQRFCSSRSQLTRTLFSPLSPFLC